MNILNNTVLLRIIVSILLMNTGHNTIYAQSYDSDNKIKTILHAFYTTYIRAGCEELSPNFETKLERIKMRYCTSKFVKNLKERTETGEIDWDPLIDAQDFNPKWIQTLSIKKDFERINEYDVSYFDDYEHKDCIMKVTVSKHGDDFLIDNVLLYGDKWLFN